MRNRWIYSGEYLETLHSQLSPDIFSPTWPVFQASGYLLLGDMLSTLNHRWECAGPQGCAIVSVLLGGWNSALVLVTPSPALLNYIYWGHALVDQVSWTSLNHTAWRICMKATQYSSLWLSGGTLWVVVTCWYRTEAHWSITTTRCIIVWHYNNNWDKAPTVVWKILCQLYSSVSAESPCPFYTMIYIHSQAEWGLYFGSN